MAGGCELKMSKGDQKLKRVMCANGKWGRGKTTLQQCKDALRKSGGMLSQAADMLNISRGAMHIRVKRNPCLQKVIDAAVESTLDIAETELIKLIKAGDQRSIFFYLERKGRHRGYGKKYDLNYNNMKKNEWTIEIVHKTNDNQIEHKPIEIDYEVIDAESTNPS